MGRSSKWFHMLGEIENNNVNSSVELRTKGRFSR